MSDLHVRVLRSAARRARERLSTHRAATVAPATEQEAEDDRRLEHAVSAADGQLSQSMERRRQPVPAECSVAELDALAAHARQRLVDYRSTTSLGRGRATKLAQLERSAAGAQERAGNARRGGRASIDSHLPPKDMT